jgi:hypothetical protein
MSTVLIESTRNRFQYIDPPSEGYIPHGKISEDCAIFQRSRCLRRYARLVMNVLGCFSFSQNANVCNVIVLSIRLNTDLH